MPAGTKPGTKIDVPNANGTVGSYIYDPSNPNADANGLVPAGVSGQGSVVVVTSSRKPNSTTGSTQAFLGGPTLPDVPAVESPTIDVTKPSPRDRIGPILEFVSGTFLKVAGTIGGVLISTPAGTGSANRPDINPGWVTYPGHGNKKDNWNPHFVYMFWYTPTDSRTPILKYGIADAIKAGPERPEMQLAGLKARFGNTVDWVVLRRTLNRQMALNMEKDLVLKHLAQWGYRPLAQKKP